MIEAVAVFNDIIKGSVTFTQKLNTDIVYVSGQLKGFQYYVTGKPYSKHGIHIHESGDLRRGCESACDHFNPFNKKHGDLNDENSHAGDFGNIIIDNKGHCDFAFQTQKISLNDPIKNIIGRTLIIHSDEDDLGKGGHSDSLTTGHSGRRIACAIIGISEKTCYNY